MNVRIPTGEFDQRVAMLKGDKDRLTRVLRATTRILEAENADDVLRALTEEARALIGAHQSHAQFSVGEKILHAASLSEKHGQSTAARIGLPDSRWFCGCDTRPVRLTQEELDNHPAWIQLDCANERFPSIRGWLSAPFVSRSGETLGLIRLSDKEFGDFSESDENTLVHLAAIATAAFQKLRFGEQRYILKDRLRSMFEAASVGMAICDPDGNFVECNDAYCRMMGYSREELLQRPFLSIIHPDDRERSLDLYGRMVHGSIPNFQIENRLVRKDGAVIWTKNSTAVARDPAGTPITTSTIVADVTEQKSAEQQLRNAESLLAFAGSLVRVGAWSVDLAANRVSWSDEVCAIHECPIGTSPTVQEGINFYTPEWRDLIAEAFEKCVRDGIPFDMELQIQTAKGRRLWVRTRGEPERDTAGKIVRVRGAFQDITAFKQAREEAFHLAARLRNTLESITDAFFTVDRDWRFTYLNKEAEALLKRSREDLLGKKIWDEFQEAVGTRFYTEYHRALDRNLTVGFEEYYPPLKSWFQVRAYPSIEGLAVYFLNVTAEREAKKALEESETRFRALADTATAAIWDWNIETGKVWWSKGYKVLFGYDITEIQNPKDFWRSRIHPNDRERVLADLEIQLRGNGTTYSSEYRFLRKDGSVAQIVDRGFITRDEHGRAVRANGRMSDRTKVYEYQKQLRDRAALLEKASSAIVLRSLDHRILYWNAGAERLYGWTTAEAVGSTVHGLGYNDSLLFDEATEATTTFGEWTGEMTHHRKSGAPIKVEGHWTLVRDDEGCPNAILSVNTDLTKRLEAEELALRSQRLEAIGQLTGGIAHDFNNLLTVILGNSEVLVEQLSADERLSSLASMIRMAAERGGDLTNHLLAFARRQALDPKALDVDELTRKMDGLLRRTLGEHIELEFASPDDLWKALADEAQLESAILNVCINARDAMPGGGRLVIETANVQLDQATVEGSQEDVRPGNYVMITISDTGSGMSEEVLSRAFEPFFTTKEIGKGSGLGLSMVYGFAKQSGGSVRIASEIGRGTTVRLYLPRVDQPSESLPELPPKSIDMLTGTESILLVEDEDIVRRYAHQLLTSLGYKVSPVANGPEALAALRTTADYDLLFTDIVMPGGLDGWRLADEARRIRPHLKVLFTSGYTDKAAHPGLRRGTLLLNKPYKPHELATKIRVALSGAPKGVNG